MLKFIAKSDQELAAEAAAAQAMRLLPDGVYPFEITKAADETSKAGNPMIHLEVTVFHDDMRICLDDYLLEKLAFKLKHFCASAGLLDLYQQGTLKAEDCMGKQGWVRVSTEKGRPKDNGGFFADKNKVNDYVPAPAGKAGIANPPPTDAQLANLSDKQTDDVPF